MNKLIIGCLLLAGVTRLAGADEKPKVELRDEERIALVGNEFFERDLDRGYIETELTSRFPNKNLTFRNLGYSGDTVDGDARNLCAGWENFGPADQGFNRLKKLVEHIKPTLVLLDYGMNESFDGPQGLEHYRAGLGRMIDMLSAGGARVALVSPIRHEDLGRPLPDPAEHNRNLQLYVDATQKIADERRLPFVNLFAARGSESPGSDHWTSDGIHLNPYGYWRVAGLMEQAMGYSPREWNVAIDLPSKQVKAAGTKIELEDAAAGTVEFTAQDELLPLAPRPESSSAHAQPVPGEARTLKVTGLPSGRYALHSGQSTLATASADEWAKGVRLTGGPAEAQEESLRHTVIAKNFDFFNYWRPQNDTYIFGYRQHEQGRNAVEIPRFEPLVEAKDSQIATLRVPRREQYKLVPAETR